MPADRDTARARLERMVAAHTDPKLEDAELEDLVDLARRVDAYGLKPSDSGWTPTYDLVAAAAEGWDWKAGKASARVDVTDGGDRIAAQQTFEQCRRQADRYRARVVGSIGFGGATGWTPVIGNVD